MSVNGFDDSKNRKEVYTKEEADVKYKTRGDFVVIIGTIAMPEANDSNLSGSATINYPTGFTNNNSVIVGLMAHNTINTDRWSTRCAADAIGMYLGSGDLRATLTPENIMVNASKADVVEDRKDVTFKLVLMKYEVLDSEYTLGDVNQDGQITQEDAELALSFSTGKSALTEQQIKAADINKDGIVLAEDALKIQEYVEGTIDSLE